MIPRDFTPLRLSFAALAGVAVAAATYTGLAWLATPRGFEADVERLEAQLERAERLARLPSKGGRYADAAVCAGRSDSDLALLQGRLGASAAHAGVVLTDLTLRTGEAAPSGRIGGVAVRIHGEGQQEAIMAWLRGLAFADPEIFVDTLDLRTEADAVAVRLSGKVFCWTS